MNIFIMIFSASIRCKDGKEGEFQKTWCMFKASRCSLLMHQGWKNMTMAPAMSNQQSLMEAAVETSPFIYLHSSSSNWHLPRARCCAECEHCKDKQQFSLQGAQRLEGDTHKLILQNPVGCAIQDCDWAQMSGPVFESHSVTDELCDLREVTESLSSVSSSIK